MGKGAHDGGREPETEAAQPRQDALRAHRREPRPHLPRNHRRAGRGGHRGRAQIGVPRLGRPSRLRVSTSRSFPRTRSATPSSRTPSPPPSSCCSPTPCSPRAFSRFAWPIASPKGWRLWAPATRPPRFPRTCTWKAASRCRTNRCSTTWTHCTRPSAAPAGGLPAT